MIHKGIALNVRLLLTMISDANPDFQPRDFERLSDKDWQAKQATAVPLIEYEDTFLFGGEDLNNVYVEGNPIRDFRIFRLVCHPDMQLLAHLLNGSRPRLNFAAYAGKSIPRAEVLIDKVRSFVELELRDLISQVLSFTPQGEHCVGIDSVHLNFEPVCFSSNNYI
jgi:hypothetical protein